jgi:hypothetical protein
MPRHAILFAALAASIAGLAPADAQQPPPRPCAAIRQVCLNAGFVMNGARAGEGLIVDCIRPIMQGTPQPARASKPLPAVDPALVEACRAQNPNFGIGNAQAPQARPSRNGPGTPPQQPQGPGPGPGPANAGPAPQEGPGGPPAEPPQGPPAPR